MHYVECPAMVDDLSDEIMGNNEVVFMSGGITHCSDWQQEMCKLLSDQEVILINPRRKVFDKSDLSLEREQIKWEHLHLDEAGAVLFWFPKETLCPITLFELGKVLGCGWQEVFVGCHPEYQRVRDVKIQLEQLYFPPEQIVDSLEALADQVKEYLK